jgi:hypothetical protein
MEAAGGPVWRKAAVAYEARPWRPGKGRGRAERGRERRPKPAIPAESAARVGNRNVFWCPRSSGWAALCRRRRRVTSNGQSSASGGRTNRVADSAVNMGMAKAAGRRRRERWASKTQPSLHFAQPTFCPAYALLRRRVAGFGRRERRRRRCGGNGGHQASAASHPMRVNRGLLGRTRPRRGQQLFTCKRRDAREASLPLRCYAESREGPGLHRQPRPGDRRCVGRPPSASAEAGL